jgi:Uncharacterized protein conserved in bacteria
MNKSLEQVASFHKLFEHPIAEGPYSYEPLKIRQLRIKLLFEELSELAGASDCRQTMRDLCYAEHVALNFTEDGDNVDKIEELDALCDIQYVLNGKILTSGLHGVFDESFDTVHHNNMAKAHRNETHAKETAEKLGLKDYTIRYRNGVCVLVNEYEKVIKPHDHVKVKLEL